MDSKTEITVEDVETLGLNKKYFEIQPQEGESDPQFMVRTIRALGVDPSQIVVRRLSRGRVPNTLFIGTDRVSLGITSETENEKPWTSKHGPRYEYQEIIMKDKALNNSQVLWGLKTDPQKPEDVFEHLYRNPEEDAISVYRVEDLEVLNGSFLSFKGNPQKALIAVFANLPLKDIPKQ